MTSNDEKLEEVLSKALELYNNGKSIPEIFSLFPNYRQELEEVFQTIRAVEHEGEKIVPSKELLAKIISEIQLTEEVTDSKESRYLYRGAAKGRPSIEIIKHKIVNLMTWNWKVVLPIGVVVVLVAVILVSQLGTKAPQVTEEQAPSPVAEQSTPTSPIAEKPAALPPATGNVDDAVNAILAAIDNESPVLNEDDADVSLVAADSQVISDFGQSYDENAF